MEEVTTIDLDLAKEVFRIHGADEAGTPLRVALKSGHKVVEFVEAPDGGRKVPACDADDMNDPRDETSIDQRVADNAHQLALPLPTLAR